jgi:uncharacterized membrane protein (DUF106 family)
MLRKVLIIILLAILSSFYISGCDKTSRDSDTESEEVVELKTTAEYEAEAEKQITEENVEEELKKLEEAVNKEISE